MPDRDKGDASAALGIIGRRGLGKVRHIDTSHLWIQETAANKRAHYRKVEGSVNPADLMTKALPAATAHEHMEALGEIPAAGRSQLAASADLCRVEDKVSNGGLVEMECARCAVLAPLPEAEGSQVQSPYKPQATNHYSGPATATMKIQEGYVC